MTDAIAVSIETAPKRAFATAMDWPGWSRAGRTEELALEALGAYAIRYAVVAVEAGEDLGTRPLAVVERTPGGSGTDFGVPSAITRLDARPVSLDEGDRLARLVAAAWIVFDRVSAAAPAELRRGPRGGGRDRDKMVAHVIESDWYYARETGIKPKQPDPADRDAIETQRAAVLDILRRPSDGSPLGGRTWTPRYAARRIAWHALDHAWEMEDRADR
jgi:hypothetical protein